METTTLKTGLSFGEAKEVLSTPGNKVKLPEWTGYWFSDDEGNIKVMAKNGDILDTPWFGSFNDRTDWEVTDGALGFDWAINALKNCKKVRRRGWNGKGMWLLLREAMVSWNEEELSLFSECNVKENKIEGVKYVVNHLPAICMKTADNMILTGWLASQTDMLAEDWELAA